MNFKLHHDCRLSCQYSKDMEMPEYSCKGECQYIVAELKGISMSKITVTVKKMIQLRQYEPYELTVSQTVEDVKDSKAEAFREDLFEDVNSFVNKAIRRVIKEHKATEEKKGSK